MANHPRFQTSDSGCVCELVLRTLRSTPRMEKRRAVQMEPQWKFTPLGLAAPPGRIRRLLPRKVQMKDRYFAITDIWQFPQSAVPSVLSEMAIDGSKGNEGIALFLGVDAGTTTEITHLV